MIVENNGHNSKKEIKLQNLTVVQHQKVYDTQRSKMKHMHVNCIMNIILKKKRKGRIVQHQKCIVHNGLQSKMKTKKVDKIIRKKKHIYKNNI